MIRTRVQISREYVIKTFAYTALALTAFAFNSILCRMALLPGEADAAGFTAVRLISGAVTLAAILFFAGRKIEDRGRGNWFSAFFLFAYAICFSFAYLGLTTGTGALVLFGSVQLTMIGVSIVNGDRPRAMEWLGLLVAAAGLVYLVSPGLAAPPLGAALWMAAAGVAWGFYTLRGKGSANPLGDTAGNFVRSVPMVLIAAVPFVGQINVTPRGAVLAVLSGAVASGIGYTVWYRALRGLTATRAAAVQLAVPVIAAVGGVVLLEEAADLRLVIAGALVLGGIALVILRK